MIEIDKNVPLTEARGKTSWMALARKMEVGDSALVASRSEAATLFGSLNRLYQGRGEPSAAATRTVEGGFRVWRVR